MSKRVLVIGAGHNGLIVSFYLAHAGYSVTILDRCAEVGGAACNYRMPCGCEVSRGANTFGMLAAEIQTDMRLDDYGLRLLLNDPAYSLMCRTGAVFDWFNEPQQTASQLESAGVASRSSVDSFCADLACASSFFEQACTSGEFHERDLVARLNQVRHGVGDRFVLGSLRDAVGYYFDTEVAQSLAAATSVLYPAKTSEPGTAFPLVYLALSQVGGQPGSGIVVGGMGRLTLAMAQAARDAGVDIHLRKEVSALEHDGVRVMAAVLSSGETISANLIVSNADPVSTDGLLQPSLGRQLPYDLVRHFKSTAHKGNFVLDRVPPALLRAFCVPVTRSLVVINGDLANMDVIHDPDPPTSVRARPYLELALSSLRDRSITCCASHHVLSAFGLGHLTLTAVVAELDGIFPGFASALVHADWLTPNGIQAAWGMHAGNVDHGNMLPDNRLDARAARVATMIHPLENLFLCGSGRFPGGLVSGRPALHCLRDMRKAAQCQN